MFVICGKTASGKDTIANKLEEIGYERIVTYTTRPPRPGEVADKAYHFISEEQFEEKIRNMDFLEYRAFDTEFGRWYYGSEVSELDMFDDKTFIILSPSGVKALLDKCGASTPEIIYIYANTKTIQTRLVERGDSTEESIRRLYQDNIDFRNMPDIANRIIYNNLNDNIDDVVDQITYYLRKRKERKNA